MKIALSSPDLHHLMWLYRTGNLEITIQNDEGLERAKALLLKSYEVS